MSRPLLVVEAVRRVYGGLTAVDGVGFDVAPSETFGIVGESGSGKSTLARMVMALERPNAGRILFDGADVAVLSGARLRAARAGFQMVFQDPYSSLDPRMRVGRIVGEPLHLKPDLSRAARAALVAETLLAVGLRPEDGERFPHQFSGGQRQRIAIARALVCGPKLIVADEPVSALDVSVQAQILNLLSDLKESRGLSLLFISHDLAVVEHMADRMAVMKEGRFVEMGPADEIFRAPKHPYTRLLLDGPRRTSVPRPLSQT